MFRLSCVSLLQVITTLYFLQGILLTNTKIYTFCSNTNQKSVFARPNGTSYQLQNNASKYVNAQDRKSKIFKILKKFKKLGPNNFKKQKKAIKFIKKKLPEFYQAFSQPSYQQHAQPVKIKHKKKKKQPAQCVPIEYLQHLNVQGNRYNDYEYVYDDDDDDDDEDYSILEHLGNQAHGYFAAPPMIPFPAIPIFHQRRRTSHGNGGKRRFWRFPPAPTPTAPQVLHKIIKTASIVPKVYGIVKFVQASRTPTKVYRPSPPNYRRPPQEIHIPHYASNFSLHEALVPRNLSKQFYSSQELFASNRAPLKYTNNYYNFQESTTTPKTVTNNYFGLQDSSTTPKTVTNNYYGLQGSSTTLNSNYYSLQDSSTTSKTLNNNYDSLQNSSTMSNKYYHSQTLFTPKVTPKNATNHYYSSKYRDEVAAFGTTATTQQPLVSHPSNREIFGIARDNFNTPQLFRPGAETPAGQGGQQIISYHKNYVNYFNNNGATLRNVSVPKVLFSPTTTEAYRVNDAEKWRALPKYNPTANFSGKASFLPSSRNRSATVVSYEVNEDFMEISTQGQYLIKPKN